uniref:Uncharacterized protein n=2 Tax=root TaxID=1 RepID=A0A481Z0H2_9VIRU|nr:MAG: uncharacterized protein LCMAC202_06460 [Marseillevirus LCMAC202]
MSTKIYRLKVRKIPLPEDIVYKRPNFSSFQELHLDLLENKSKLKKNPPKPIFVRNEKEPVSKRSSASRDHDDAKDEDFTLEELERAYNRDETDNEDVFSDHEDEPSAPDSPEKHRGEYQQEKFKQEEEEEEDEEERERREKADLLFKFMVLRRQYPNVEITEFTEHSDINTMRRVYDQIIRRVSLDSSVDNYKQYLVGGFMVLEWVSTNWLGIDLSGFTQQQVKMMNRYERLLIELGEKNYSTMGSRFPVEVRLIFFIIFNAGLFYVQKMIFSGGEGGTNVLNALFGGVNTQQQQEAAPRRRRRGGMRGPTITPHEVEDFTRRHQDNEDEDESDHDKEE